MSKRAASSVAGADGAVEARGKRQRIYEQAVVSFDGINSDCKVNILSFLSAEEMNSFAICSRDCRRIRANESLDQTRTATIICAQDTNTVHSFLKTMRDNQFAFTGNRTRLKIVGGCVTNVNTKPTSAFRVEGATSLDCSLIFFLCC